MALLYSKFTIFSSPPTITTTPPIKRNLGNANHFKPLQPSPHSNPKLEISTRNAGTPHPLPSYLTLLQLES